MAPLRVSVPPTPSCVRVPVPEMTFDTVGVSVRSNTRFALSVTAPVPRLPVVPPFPICIVPVPLIVVVPE